MGRCRWGTATDTGDPLSLVQVFLNKWSEIRTGSSDGVSELAFHFFAGTLVVSVINRLTAPIRAEAVRLCLWRSSYDDAGPLFATPHLHFLQMSPSNKVREEELTGELRTRRRPLWTIFSLMSILLAAVFPPHPPPSFYCRGTCSETTRMSPYFFLQRHKEGRYAFNHPLSPLCFFFDGQANKSCHSNSCRFWVIITGNYPSPGNSSPATSPLQALFHSDISSTCEMSASA